MEKPISFPLFCYRYGLEQQQAESLRLYHIYLKHLDTFYKVMSKLIVNQAIEKAKAKTK